MYDHRLDANKNEQGPMHDLNLRVRTGVVDDPRPVDATGKDDNVVDLNPIL